MKKGIWVLLVVIVFSFSVVWAQEEGIKALHREILYPTVRVRVATSGGSGTIVYSKDDNNDGVFSTYGFTNWHVVKNNIKVEERWNSTLGKNVEIETLSPIRVEIFEYQNWSNPVAATSVIADIVFYDENEDFAIFKLRLDRHIQFVANLLDEKEFSKVYLFQRTRMVGASLGEPPLPTDGEISVLNKLIDGKIYFGTNAPGIFGNSGGGVYIKRNGIWNFIGIPSRIPFLWGAGTVEHMMYFIPLTRIYKILRDSHFEFLYDTSISEKDAYIERQKLKESQ